MMFCFLVLALCLLNISQAAECPKWEVPVKSHPMSYGSPPKKTIRTAHCREIYPHSRTIIAKLRSSVSPTNPIAAKSWIETDIEVLIKSFAGVRLEFLRHFPAKIYRVKNYGSPSNPAAVHNLTREMWITDAFITANDRTRILHHEMAHIIFHKMSPEMRIAFAIQTGWKPGKKNDIMPPKKLLTADSSQSTSEDFANHVEWWLHDKNKVQAPSPKIGEFIEKALKDMQ